jgi:5,10-methylenetetrahydromethanopterin reductase
MRGQVDSLSAEVVGDTTGRLREETADTVTKPLRIGALIEIDKSLPETVASLQRYADAGLAHAFATQIFSHDALTLLAAAGAQVPGIGLGTGVVPVYPRHPMVLAQQALTVQAMTDNRLILGIGLSHQVVVEGMWGLSYDKPARYMKEYLASLMPLLRRETVNFAGEFITTNAFQALEGPDWVTPPTVLVAALGPVMLGLAGRVADGTITWMTGPATIEAHIAPTIRAAAAAAGRPEPRVVVSIPVTVTTDVAAAKERLDKELAIYPHLPSYRAMLDKEGADVPSDIAFIGDEDAVRASIENLNSTGTTDYVAYMVGHAEERARTFALLSDMAAG